MLILLFTSNRWVCFACGFYWLNFEFIILTFTLCYSNKELLSLEAISTTSLTVKSRKWSSWGKNEKRILSVCMSKIELDIPLSNERWDFSVRHGNELTYCACVFWIIVYTVLFLEHRSHSPRRASSFLLKRYKTAGVVNIKDSSEKVWWNVTRWRYAKHKFWCFCLIFFW